MRLFMKNFSNAVVLCATLLFAGNALAVTKTEATNVAGRLSKLGVAVVKFQERMEKKRMKSNMTIGDKNALMDIVLSCKALLGSTETSATTRAKVVAVLVTLSKAVTAEINVNYDVELVKLAADINKLLIDVNNGWNRGYLKNTVNSFKKARFQDVATRAILNDAVFNRIETAQAA